MALRAKKPTLIKKRLKALFYGAAGVGKTMAAIQFPRPYLIDTERGAENDQYTKALEKGGGVIFQTNDFDDLLSEVKALISENHEYKTLIIDPFTNLYNDLLDKSAEKNGTEFGRHYNDANKIVKHLLNLLNRLDMNVIVTAHSKNEYGPGLTVLGQTFDAYKKLDHLFDVVFEIQKRGSERVAITKKSRIEELPDGEIFPFSYNSIANKYGREILEKDAIPTLLATKEQLDQLKSLIDTLNTSKEIQEKWLSKSKAETFDEMPSDSIQKCIDHLNSQIKNIGDIQ